MKLWPWTNAKARSHAPRSRIERYPANRRGRDLVVGDIHGCFELLESALDRLDFDRARDRLFSVGDLMDRGPSNERAPDFLAESWFFTVRGNHEQMLLDAVTPGADQDNKKRLWHLNGGDWFNTLWDDEQARIETLVAAIPYALEVGLPGGGTAAIVHADVVANSWPKTRDLLESGRNTTEISELLWSRDRVSLLSVHEGAGDEPLPIAVRDIDVIFFGHTPLRNPTAKANTRWLDTGAVFGNALAIAELARDGRVWAFDAASGAPTEGWARQ